MIRSLPPAFGRRWLRLLIAIMSLSTLALTCFERYSAPLDPMLDGDWIDPRSGEIAFALPGRPIFSPGRDGEFGTEDDRLLSNRIGDLDLVLRTGITDTSGPLPAPALSMMTVLSATMAPDGMGNEVDFVVAAVDSMRLDPLGDPVFSPSIEGNPMIVLAFADLDADGWIGPTLRDGDSLDGEVESAELEPIGMMIVPVIGGRAIGRMRLLAGGPAGNPSRVLLTAAAFTGDLDPTLFAGVVPTGTPVTTAQPILPETSVDDVIEAGAAGPEPVTPDRPIPVRIKSALTPAPSDPLWGEHFSIRLDGSEISVDGAISFSGPTVRVGIARSARLLSYKNLNRRVVRGGLDDAGQPHPYEVAERITVVDDGSMSDVEVRLVPLDRLGNISDLDDPLTVLVTTGGIVEIDSPDSDGDPYSETVVIHSAIGIALRLNDPGTTFDDPLADTLVLESMLGGAIIDLLLPDPDVDDSGIVDATDLSLVNAALKIEVGELFFQSRLDVNGDGRIDKKDAAIVTSLQGLSVPVP